jgi:hypothetical protein
MIFYKKNFSYCHSDIVYAPSVIDQKDLNLTPAVSGSLDKKRGRRCHLPRNKRWHPLPPILSNEPGTRKEYSYSTGTWSVRKTRAGLVKEKRGKKVPSFIKQKVASSSAFFV